MTPVDELREHVLDLEIRLAYSDRRVAALDEVVQTFAARVEILERELKGLKPPVRDPADPADPANRQQENDAPKPR